MYNLLLVFTKLEQPTDRDSFKFKRVEVPGKLMYDLFKEYFKLEQDNIKLSEITKILCPRCFCKGKQYKMRKILKKW